MLGNRSSKRMGALASACSESCLGGSWRASSGRSRSARSRCAAYDATCLRRESTEGDHIPNVPPRRMRDCENAARTAPIEVRDPLQNLLRHVVCRSTRSGYDIRRRHARSSDMDRGWLRDGYAGVRSRRVTEQSSRDHRTRRLVPGLGNGCHRQSGHRLCAIRTVRAVDGRQLLPWNRSTLFIPPTTVGGSSSIVPPTRNEHPPPADTCH